MQDEQNRGLAFVNALDEPRRKQAILSFAKESDNNLTEAWKDNVVLDYAGIRAAGLSDAQRTQLLDLIALYVGNMDDGHAKVKMADVRAHLDRTYFAWIGPTDAEQRLLLPHPQPGDPDRVRSPAPGGHPAPDRSEPADAPAHSRGGADAERQRLRQGSAAAALPAASALIRTDGRRPNSIDSRKRDPAIASGRPSSIPARQTPRLSHYTIHTT